MHLDAEFWVALGFVIFVIGLGYLGVHTKLNGALDDRARKISAELAEAKRLRDEAETLLQSYRQRAKAAEAEAAAIVAQAKTEAEIMAKDAETRMADFVTRRTKQAESKIAMAETQAAADVRAAAADAAVAMASHIFKSDPQGTGATALVEREIGMIGTKLN